MQKNKAQFFDNMSTQAQKENSSSDAAAVAKPTKPTRPLTAYHLFFQLEREFMLPLASSGIDFIYYWWHSSCVELFISHTKNIASGEYILQTTQDKDDTARSNIPKEDRPIGKQLDKNMPFRYRYIHLSPYWYASGSGKRINDGKTKAKRKHRKTHGKISFLDLSRCIASRWAQLEEKDNMTKMYVSEIAARQLKIYKAEMKLFKASAATVAPASKHTIAPCNCDSCTSVSEHHVQLKSDCVHVMSPPPPKASVKFDAETFITTPIRRTISKTNSDRQLDLKGSSQNEEDVLPSVASSFDFGSNNDEFSFHPVPSSFWKRYKKSAKKGSRRSSYDSSASPNKMSSRSFGPRPHAPYSYGRNERMPAQSRKSWPPSDQMGESMQGSFKSDQYKHHRGYHSTQLELENEMDSFLSRVGHDQEIGRKPSGNFCHPTSDQPMRVSMNGSPSEGLADALGTVDITSDDAMGLIKALSEGDE